MKKKKKVWNAMWLLVKNIFIHWWAKQVCEKLLDYNIYENRKWWTNALTRQLFELGICWPLVAISVLTEQKIGQVFYTLRQV